MRNLHALPIGRQARLTAVGGERSFRRRLMELGLLPGTAVRVIRRVPLGGLVELEVRRGRLTVRCDEADQLFVEEG
jgi:ferrous iron transport protein A